MRALPYSMMAHSASTCQCSSRTPPAVSRISTPAMVVEIGKSRTVTWRVQPPLSRRLREREKEYLNGFTLPLSVGGHHSESGFSAASGPFTWPGLISFGAVCLADWASAILPPTMVSVVAATAAEPSPNISRLLNFVSSFSISAIMLLSILDLSKHIGYVCKRVVVVFAARCLIQVLASKQMTETEAIGDVTVLFILGDQVQFRSQMATCGSRMRGYGDRATGGIDRIVFRRQPEIVHHLRQRPLLANIFFNARADVLDVPPAELIGEGHLVVSGRVDLVVRAPRGAVWVLIAGGVIVLGK